MTPPRLRDAAMTFFIAGHETTAQMLAWTWSELGENLAVEARLHDELHDGLGGRLPEATEFGRLPYLQAVMNEILRLYPPAYITARETIESCELGGCIIPAEKMIIFSQWVAHRDPHFYDDPPSAPRDGSTASRNACQPVPTFHSATERGGALDKDSRSSKRWS
jgi:cytochrome P450